jgi:hypothetical protein
MTTFAFGGSALFSLFYALQSARLILKMTHHQISPVMMLRGGIVYTRLLNRSAGMWVDPLVPPRLKLKQRP